MVQFICISSTANRRSLPLPVQLMESVGSILEITLLLWMIQYNLCAHILDMIPNIIWNS